MTLGLDSVLLIYPVFNVPKIVGLQEQFQAQGSHPEEPSGRKTSTLDQRQVHQ